MKYKTKITFCLVSLMLCASFARHALALGVLQVSGNGHYLTTPQSQPFFYLGDTEWALNKHTDQQIIDLLADRQEKGYTVIQVFSSRNWNAPYDWARTDVNGSYPFAYHDDAYDITQLNTDYWNRWRWVADRCAERNLYLSLHVGEAGRMEDPWHCENYGQCYEFGRQVGGFFNDKNNVIFNIGQDMLGSNGIGVDGWRAIAEGVADGWNEQNNYDDSADYSTTFMTFHPSGNSPYTSSTWFHSDNWLDSNGMEVWHSYLWSGDLYSLVNNDYNLTNPTKPILMVEGGYEDESDSHAAGGHLSPRFVRLEAWNTYFSGGAGYGYGNCHNWDQYASIDYTDSPGAYQMEILGDFMTTREWWKFIPDQGMVTSGVGNFDTRKAAVRSSDGDECYIYYPLVETASINLNRITTSSTVNAQWLDPRSGSTQSIGSYSNSETVSFTPPSGWEDALLMLTAESGPIAPAAPTALSVR